MQFAGKRIDKRTETDSLHYSLNYDPRPAQSDHILPDLNVEKPDRNAGNDDNPAGDGIRRLFKDSCTEE